MHLHEQTSNSTGDPEFIQMWISLVNIKTFNSNHLRKMNLKKIHLHLNMHFCPFEGCDLRQGAVFKKGTMNSQK